MPTDDLAARLAALRPAQRDRLTNLLRSAAGPDAASATAPASPRSRAEEELVRIWRDVLRTQSIWAGDNFLALGGDSITSLRVSAKAAAAGIWVTPRQVLEAETLTELAAVAEFTTGEAAVGQAVGETILTPIQRWFFEQNLPDAWHWDQAVFVEVRSPVRADVLRPALVQVARHHDALRSRFSYIDGEWTQYIEESSGEPYFAVVDLAGLSDDARAAKVRTESTSALRQIDLASGPLVSAVLFTGQESMDRLLLAVHHLVVDSVSMRILLEDLAAACRMLADGQAAVLPPKSAPLRWWSQQLARYARSPAITSQLDYWLSVPVGAYASAPILEPCPDTGAAGRSGRRGTVALTIPPEVVSGLRDAGRLLAGASLADVLVTGFLLAWRERTGRQALQLDLEGHGREPVGAPIDVSRTVGWFSTLYPAVLSLTDDPGPAAIIRGVHEQLAEIPGNGIGYGLLRYLGGSAGARLASLPQSLVSFNYLGWFGATEDDPLFSAPLPVPVPSQSDRAPRQHVLEVVVTGTENGLGIELTYPRAWVAEQDITALGDAYRSAIETLAAPEYVPTALEFPSMRLDSRQISAIARQLDR